MNTQQPSNARNKMFVLAGVFIFCIALMSLFLYNTGLKQKEKPVKEEIVDISQLPVDVAKAKATYNAVIAIQEKEKTHKDSVNDYLKAYKDSVDYYQDSINAIVPRTRSNIMVASSNYTVRVNNKVMQRVLQYESIIRLNARKFGHEANLILGMVHHESLGASDTVSSAGAIGLMAMMPKTGAEMGYTENDLFNPKRNIEAGCKYLAKLIAEHGSVELGLAMYEAGSRGIKSKIKAGENVVDRDYIKHVLAKKKLYTNLTAQNLVLNNS